VSSGYKDKDSEVYVHALSKMKCTAKWFQKVVKFDFIFYCIDGEV